jgi:hypothetical protein
VALRQYDALHLLRNKQKPCDNCGLQRHGHWRYCCACGLRRKRRGHPQQRPIYLQDLLPYKREAMLFLRKHKCHRGIPVARAWLNRWLKTSDNPYISRLSAAGIKGKAVLLWILAVYFHREDQPGTYKSDESFNAILALTVFRRLKELTGNTHPSQGKMRDASLSINIAIGPFLLNSSRAWAKSRTKSVALPAPSTPEPQPKPRTIRTLGGSLRSDQ